MTEGYRAREIAARVQEALRAMPVVVLTGLRQSGKTTFLRHDPRLRGRRYLTLDDFGTLEAARRQPESLLEGAEPLTIDEVQRCPGLLVAVKTAVDRRRTAGRFLLSGSANLGMLRGVSESLAGRAVYLTLHPFTRRERLGRVRDKPFLLSFLEGTSPLRHEVKPLGEAEVLDGGLPPVVLGETTSRHLWLLGYEQTYLERDVRSLTQVADLVSFRNLLHLTALRSGQLLNQSELARDARLPVSTVTRHLGILEASFVTTRVPPYLRSRTTRLLKSPKIYLSDAGLAAHLTGVDDIGAAADEPLRGALFETFVYQNLAGILGAHTGRTELCFWNVQGRHEVDFIVASGKRCVAIEVKAGSRFTDRDLAGLRAFAQATPGHAGGILAYNGTEAVGLGDGIHAIPLGLLLS